LLYLVEIESPAIGRGHGKALTAQQARQIALCEWLTDLS
jgi:hypothetical protein